MVTGGIDAEAVRLSCSWEASAEILRAYLGAEKEEEKVVVVNRGAWRSGRRCRGDIESLGRPNKEDKLKAAREDSDEIANLDGDVVDRRGRAGDCLTNTVVSRPGLRGLRGKRGKVAPLQMTLSRAFQPGCIYLSAWHRGRRGSSLSRRHRACTPAMPTASTESAVLIISTGCLQVKSIAGSSYPSQSPPR